MYGTSALKQPSAAIKYSWYCPKAPQCFEEENKRVALQGRKECPDYVQILYRPCFWTVEEVMQAGARGSNQSQSKGTTEGWATPHRAEWKVTPSCYYTKELHSQSNTASVCHPWRDKRGLRTRLCEDRNVNFLQTTYTLTNTKYCSNYSRTEAKENFLEKLFSCYILVKTIMTDSCSSVHPTWMMQQPSLVCSEILFKWRLAKKMWYNHCSPGFIVHSGQVWNVFASVGWSQNKTKKDVKTS